ncbi:MAG: sugar ABC transporter substrate-binding protein [Candidatus Bipolaricaulota bacterium]
MTKKSTGLILSVVLVVMVGLVFGLSTVAMAQEDSPLKIGNSIWGMYGDWEHAYIQSGRWYASDNNMSFTTANALMQAEKQVKDIQHFIDLDMDGIIVGPVSSTAPINAIEDAVDAGIPVATANSDVETPAISISVSYGNKNATAALAEEVVDYLENEVEPIGEVAGTVLHLQGSLEMSIGRERSAGIFEVFEGESNSKTDKYPDLKHRVVQTNFQKQPGFEKTYNVLQAEGGEVDAIIGNSTSCRGSVEALERYGKEKGEVFIAAHGGTPPDVEMVKEGWFQRAYEQPTHFYLPIALHYLKVINEEGEEALPDIGETVTAEDLDISGYEHLGVNIWDYPSWAPAQIRESNGHRWFQTSGRIITPKNADESTLWGNIFGQEAA